MDSRWHLLTPRECDSPDVVSAKLMQLRKLVETYEARLIGIGEQPDNRTRGSPVEQQVPADESNANSQHVFGTADSAESPFRIKRKDAQPKKGALGFRPLPRSSSKPNQSVKSAGQSVKSAGPARSAVPLPEPPGEPSKAGSLSGEPQLSPSAFRTPAITRSLPQLGAQLSSDVPTEKAAGTVLHISAPEPAHNPRPWGRLQLQQHDTIAALSAQHLQQQPNSGQRAPLGSPPLQEVSNNSGGWLAPERPRGFQGKLRLRKNRYGTGALRKGVPAAASGQQGLHAHPQAASAPPQTVQHTTHDTRTEQVANQDDRPITAAASPDISPGDRVHSALEDAHDQVDITPEHPQWRSKQSSRLQQLAESAPARRHAGSGRLPLVQQLLTHPTGISALQHHQPPIDPPLRQHSPEQQVGSLGLSLEHPQGQQSSKSGSSIAIRRLQGNSSSSGSLHQLGAAGFVPETWVRAREAIPDTPDCRTSKQSLSLHSPLREAPLMSSHLQQESMAEQQRQTIDDYVDMHGAEGAPSGGLAMVNGASDVKNGSSRRDTSALPEGHDTRATHGSRYHFGKQIISAAASSCGRCIAVCLLEQGSASCSVQVWSMQEGGPALGALLLSAKGTIEAGNAAGPHNMQQLLAVSSVGDRLVLASSTMLQLEQGRSSCVSVLYKRERSMQHETLSLPTQQETACVYMTSAGRLFAAGQGGHVQCWSFQDGPPEAAPSPSCQQLPPASFGGITFPDIQHLESSGKDCILGCSSIGSVALWNFVRGELLMARQEAGHLLYGLHCLPSAWLPHPAGQPQGKCPVAALALVQRRRSGSGRDQQRHLALTLMWPEQIAVSLLSEAEAVTHLAVAGAYAGLALASGDLRLVDLRKGTRHLKYGCMKGIRGLASAGPNGLMVLFADSMILLNCFQKGQ